MFGRLSVSVYLRECLLYEADAWGRLLLEPKLLRVHEMAVRVFAPFGLFGEEGEDEEEREEAEESEYEEDEAVGGEEAKINRAMTEINRANAK